MFEYFKRFISFISFDLSAQAYLLVVIFACSLILTFILELILCLVRRKKRDTVYYLCYQTICLILITYFAIEDYLGDKILFSSIKNVYASLTVLTCLSGVFYMTLRALSNVKKSPIECKTIEVNQEDLTVKEIKPKPYEYYFYDKKVDGYLDVAYLKNLIFELKKKELSESDFSEIEGLELYLLNFVSRQPNESERVVLSEKLSMLIKKIAYYSN